MDWNRQMREDWDRRAAEDAERFIYTRDSEADAEDFARSGQDSYNQLVRPYLPILLNGRPASDCRVVEIGCGLGRMTAYFARDFAGVDALDVSPRMIEGARRRFEHAGNVRFHLGSGSDLGTIPDSSSDLVFSFIVFQHVPSRAIIQNYVREAARILKDGGVFRFQVNGDQSPEYVRHERDTWMGETYSEEEIRALVNGAGLTLLWTEGAGTRYFLVSARKGPREGAWLIPSDPASAPFLLEGFGPLSDASWRPMASQARVRIEGHGSRLYLGLYFWPESFQPCSLEVSGHRFEVACPGDHYFECAGRPGIVPLSLNPAPARPPAFRVLGVY